MLLFIKSKQEIEMDKDTPTLIDEMDGMDGLDGIQLFENQRRGLKRKGGYQQARSISIRRWIIYE